MLSVLENLFVTIKLQNSGIIKAFLRSDEAGCYHLYESSDIKIATFSNLHKRACAFGERLMLGLETYSVKFNDGSSYQCPEPGCDEDFKTQADLDFHMN